MFDLSILADAGWGFLGSFIYASGVGAACLWAGEEPAKGNRRKMCFACFLIAIAFGTTSAAAFTITTHRFVGWAELHALAFVIGGVINEAWAKMKSQIIDRITAVVSAIFTGRSSPNEPPHAA